MIKDLDKFREIVLYLKKLFDDRKARYFFSASNRIELVLTNENEWKTLLRDIGIDEDILSYTIKIEMPALLTAAISENKNALEFLYHNSDSKMPIKDLKSLLDSKLNIVKADLVTQKMRGCYLIKKTSKIKFVSGIDWEVSTKDFDDVVGKIPDLRHAVVRVNLGSSERSKLWSFYFALASGEETGLILDMDVNDVDNLIDILADIRKALISGGDNR